MYDWSSSQSLKETEKGILLEIFWSGNETSGLLTKPVNMLLEWTIYSHKEKCKSNDVSWITLQNNMIYGKFSFPSLSVGFTNMDSPSSYRNTQKSILPIKHVQTVLSILLQQSGIAIMSHLDCISYRWSIHDLKQWEDHAHAGIRVLCKNLEQPQIGDLYIWDLWYVLEGIPDIDAEGFCPLQ